MPDRLFDHLFLGAGAMKAGTTWLYSLLDRHPDIFFCFEKEVHYFYARHVRPEVLSDAARLGNAHRKYLGFDPDRANAQAIRARLRWVAQYLDGPVDDDWYRNLFCLRRGQKWVADFSNLYALLPEAAWRRIAGQTGELRLLYTLRDPIDRLWSHTKFHLQITGRGDEIATMSPAEIERFARQPFIWENAEYGAAIRRMQAGLPQGALRLAFHETIHEDPRAALRGIEDFLGVTAFGYPADLLSRRVNATAPRPIPGHFRDAFARDAERIAEELRDIGVTPPESWRPEAVAAR